MIAALLLLVGFAGTLRGPAKLPLSTALAKTVVSLGEDSLETSAIATLGSCAESGHRFRSVDFPGNGTTVLLFPGDRTWTPNPFFASISWGGPDITGGNTCGASVSQPAGGLRFEYRAGRRWLVWVDTIFYAISDGGAVGNPFLRKITDAYGRLQFAPLDSTRKWVRWIDSLDRTSIVGGQPEIRKDLQPLLTLTDSMVVDSITVGLQTRPNWLNLWVVANGSANAADYYYRVDPSFARASGVSGRRFPPGTTFRLRSTDEIGPRPFRKVYFWSGRKIFDSLLLRPDVGESVRGRRPSTAGATAAGRFDVAGSRIPSATDEGIRPGGQVVEDRGHISILFGK